MTLSPYIILALFGWALFASFAAWIFAMRSQHYQRNNKRLIQRVDYLEGGGKIEIGEFR